MRARSAGLCLASLLAIGCATFGEPPAESARIACESVGKGPPVHYRVRFENQMGNGFVLDHLAWTLDGAVPLSEIEQAKLVARLRTERAATLDLTLPEGCHQIGIHVEYQGNGAGVFAYLKGYRFARKSAHAFDAVENGTLTVVGYEQGTATTPLEERPAVRYSEQRP